jgi:hypothetical protein
LMVVEFSDQMSPFAGPLTHQKKGHHAMFWWWIHAKFLCFWMVQFKSHFSHLFNPWINGNLWPKVIEADAATLSSRLSQWWPTGQTEVLPILAQKDHWIWMTKDHFNFVKAIYCQACNSWFDHLG